MGDLSAERIEALAEVLHRAQCKSLWMCPGRPEHEANIRDNLRSTAERFGFAMPERPSPYMDEVRALAPLIDGWLAEERQRALREAADEHVAQLVCCDIYDRLKDKPSSEWTDEERREQRGHSICYWGAACAEADHAHAARITRGGGTDA